MRAGEGREGKVEVSAQNPSIPFLFTQYCHAYFSKNSSSKVHPKNHMGKSLTYTYTNRQTTPSKSHFITNTSKPREYMVGYSYSY